MRNGSTLRFDYFVKNSLFSSSERALYIMKNPSAQQPTTSSALLKWADKHDNSAHPVTRGARCLIRLILITVTEFNKNELSLRSGALTYTILLSLVPMLAMSTAIVKGVGGGNELRQAAYTYLDTLEKSSFTIGTVSHHEPAPPEMSVPEEPGNMTNHLRSAVDQLFDYVDKTNFAALGTIGVIGILLSVVLVLSNIETAMNAIWKVQNGRSIMRKIADYLTLLILMPVSINVAFAASAFLANPALSSKINILIPFPWLQTLLLQAVPVFFIALTFYAMYIFFPSTRVKALPAISGATLAAILWFGVQNVYISLQVGVAKYNAIYGSFATLPLFLVWMYLGWIFILAGAQVTYSFQNIRTYTLIPQALSPSHKLGAAFDIIDEIYSAFANKCPLTARRLTEQLPQYKAQTVEETLNALISGQIVHTSQTDSRILPTIPKERYNSKTVISIILGSEAADTLGGKKSLRAIQLAGEDSKPLT